MASPGTKTRLDGHPVIITPKKRLWRMHARLRDRLPIWVVYRPGTREHGSVWVTRMHLTLPRPRPTRFVMTHDTLESLRMDLPPGLTRLARNRDDVPEIEECWL